MNRLTRITTRTGDDGSTALADGRRLPKDSARIAAIGELDELNSQIGVVRALLVPGDPVDAPLDWIQHRLFDLGGGLALPGGAGTPPETAPLEAWIETHNATLPPLREFVLPGGGAPAAQCHLARAVCRRAERALVRLARDEAVDAAAIRFLNRLSDLLFVFARVLARRDGGEEPMWRREPAK